MVGLAHMLAKLMLMVVGILVTHLLEILVEVVIIVVLGKLLSGVNVHLLRVDSLGKHLMVALLFVHCLSNRCGSRLTPGNYLHRGDRRLRGQLVIWVLLSNRLI